MSPGRASAMASAMALRRSGSTTVLRAGSLQADESVVNNRQRIFAPGIVRSKHHKIAAAPGGFAHQRTLGAIAISAAAEQGEHSRVHSIARVTNSRASAVRLRSASSVCA
jgi:hypothetical protein